MVSGCSHSNAIMEYLKAFQQTAVRWKCSACRGLYASLVYLRHTYQTCIVQIDFSALLQSIDPVIQGSVKATLQPLYQNIVCVQQLADWTRPTGVVLPPSYILSALDQACISELQSLYSFLYTNFAASDITIHSMYHKYSKLEYCGTTYRSQLCLPGESSIVLVHHYCPSNSSMPKASPVFVHFFLKHCVTYNDQVYEHILLYVFWLKTIQLVIPLVSLADLVERPISI